MKYLIVLLLLCSCSRDLQPYQKRDREGLKFARKNTFNQKGWKVYSVALFATVLIFIDGPNSN